MRANAEPGGGGLPLPPRAKYIEPGGPLAYVEIDKDTAEDLEVLGEFGTDIGGVMIGTGALIIGVLLAVPTGGTSLAIGGAIGGGLVGAGFTFGMAGAATQAAGGMMANDPPQKKYDRPARRKPRTLKWPAHVNRHLIKSAEAALSVGVGMQNFIDSIERGQGAALARDQAWAIAHGGLAWRYKIQYIRDLHVYGLNFRAFARHLIIKKYDLVITEEIIHNISSNVDRAALKKHLKKMGPGARDIARSIRGLDQL